MKIISPEDLVPMDVFVGTEPLQIHVDYAHANNELFKEVIYRQDARLWLHKDLAKITVLAARICKTDHGYSFILYDGLRTTEAQQKMLETKRVQDNPHWLEEPRLLSPPGAGGHPRGMAIDIELLDENNQRLDMGTVFDYLAEDSSPEHNPAHRNYVNLTDEVKQNRAMLTDSMVKAANLLGLPLLPLPEEWWDFRMLPSISDSFRPISDSHLPPQMRMVLKDTIEGPKDLPQSHFDTLKQQVLDAVSTHASELSH